jgi:hypothetical protein
MNHIRNLSPESLNIRTHLTGDSELFFQYRGIRFFKEELGGFSYKEAKYLLPRVIGLCQDSCRYQRSIERMVGVNGSAIRVKIRGMEVARAKGNQSYGERQVA